MPTALPPRSSRPSLTLWLFATAVLVTVTAVVVAATWIDRLVQRQARADALHYLEGNAMALRDALDHGMSQHLQEVMALRSLQQLARATRPDDMRAVLDSFKASFPQYAWLGITDLQGRVLASSDGLLEGADVSARPWFQGARSGAFVGDVHRAVLLEKLLPRQAEPWRFVDFALPVFDGQGQLKGVLAAHLSWQWAAGVKQELSDRLAPERDIEALVLNASGEVLLGPQGTEGRPLSPGAPGYLWAEARSIGHGGFHDLGWKMVVRQPEAVAMAPFAKLHGETVAVASVVCLLATPLLWAIARLLSAPLERLTRALGEPVFGPRSAGAVPYREAHLLQQALARYDARQHEQAAELKQWAHSLEQRVAERTAKLAESERRLAEVLDNIPAMVGHFDRDERCLFANELALQVHGLKPEEAVGRALREGISPQAYERHEPYIRQVLAGRRVHFEGREVKGGRSVHYQVNLVPERSADGKVAGFYLMTFDVTALKEAKAQLERSEARLRAITDNLPVMISYIDSGHRLQFANRTFEDWTGIPSSAAVGRPLEEVIGERLFAQRREALDRALRGERVEFELESETLGVQRWLQTVYVPDMVSLDRVRGVYTLTMDVTALRNAERRMADLALHDTLTGLANRRRLNERLPEALARARRHRAGAALFFLDVDRFKSINDTHGHAVGDAVLVEFSQRLKGALRSTDFVARLAGDEFVAVLEGLHDAGEGELVARKVVDAVRRPMHTAAGALDITTSIGVAYLPGGVFASADALLALADRALYRTKQQGRDGYTCLEAEREAPALHLARG